MKRAVGIIFLLSLIIGSKDPNLAAQFLLYGVIILVIIKTILFIIKKIKEHKAEEEHKTNDYYKSTGRSIKQARSDKGTAGEYAIYKNLKDTFEPTGARFLFNVYLPKEDGTTTELDAIMICPRGLFVFESKNYSGWIFGAENEKYWMQTLPSRRKSKQKARFYNPVMQNRSHIETLKSLIGDIDIFSIIVFSNDCEFKNVWPGNNTIRVVQMRNVQSVTSELYNTNNLYINPEIIDYTYNRLLKYTNLSSEEKEKHIESIRSWKK